MAQSYTLPILASVVIHAMIVIAIAAPLIAPSDADTGIATTLVGQDDLAAAQKALQNHHKQSQKSAKSAQTTQVSSADKALMARYQSDNPYQTNRVVNSTTQIASSSTPSTPSDTGTDISTFDTFTDTTSAPSADDQLASSVSVGDHAQTTGAGTANATPTVDKLAVQQAAYRRIESAWKSQPKQPNQSMQFVVRFDDAGNVAGIDFGAGDPDLKPSIRAAVSAAAPYRELAGVVSRMTFEFRTETLIFDEPKDDNGAQAPN
ncbi:hypothetical protein NGM44_00070 [Moraxella sp. FZFQ2102]|uniref:hypothetical protein n=1 Tax=Moraxella sp. FZFQ2102 TaxID=2953752 RepID=UPI00209C68AB|nr:hypothetical protein [Moraxella sp. FZFQ2102]USZ14835.1 hypothetical protein NGM44_00070 [Moraxella sp. FZFQ2102]